MSESIKLYGLRLFDSYNGNYSVNLELIDEKWRRKVLSQKGNFTSVLLTSALRHKYQGFEFVFDEPVNINANTKYRVEALISGPASQRASSYHQNSGCFTFSSSAYENNGTNEGNGQFSEFFFFRPGEDQ